MNEPAKQKQEVVVISGEQRLEEYIKQYQHLIFSICYRLTGDYFDAEDLTQDTFLAAYKNLACFDGSHEKAWLCKIATNKCIDHLKRAGRRMIPTEDEFFLDVASDCATPENTYLEKEVKDRLLQCCNSLKEPYRSVALDYFYYDTEIGEIVQKTGKNIKTLQTQIYRAKAMLKKAYREEDLKHGA